MTRYWLGIFIWQIATMFSFIVLPSCLLSPNVTLIQLLAVPHLICLQIPKMKNFQSVIGVNTTVLMVTSTTTTASLVKAE